MSTVAYAEFTNKREEAKPGKSTTAEAPGVRTWVDALASLVPAEVLAAHALIISMTTQTTNTGAATVTVISDAQTLGWVFYVLAAVSLVLYALARSVAKTWDRWDFVRMLIPPMAFVGWTMLQPASAFDAAYPGLDQAPRTAIAVIGAIVLGAIAAALAFKADQKSQSS